MTRKFLLLALVSIAALLLSGCQERPTDDDDTGGEVSCGDDEAVVHFDTEDGETLEADYWPADATGAPSVALFHMNPVDFDRSGYPQRVRQGIQELGVNVLNVDRRGAGGSTGSTDEATIGPGAAADVRAAVTYLTGPDSGCEGDPGRLNLVGASNGTTGVYDYLVTAETDFPFPATVVFMSPGGYTETNYPINSDPEDGGWNLSFPILWIYPSNEDFSNAYVPDAPGAWDFQQIGNEHGTNMFDGAALESDAVDLVTSWVGEFGT
jgi:hypothetical protein